MTPTTPTCPPTTGRSRRPSGWPSGWSTALASPSCAGPWAPHTWWTTRPERVADQSGRTAGANGDLPRGGTNPGQRPSRRPLASLRISQGPPAPTPLAEPPQAPADPALDPAPGG